MNLHQTLGPAFEPERIENAVQSILSRLEGRKPRLALVLGSGWKEILSGMQTEVTLPLAEIPGFPQPSVSGHGAELICGQVSGLSLLALTGRKHLYENEGLGPVLFPIEIFARLAVPWLGLTNSAGSARPKLPNGQSPMGSLMVIRDHLDTTWHRWTSPLAEIAVEKGLLAGGDPIYDEAWKKQLLEIGREEQLPIFEGVYSFTLGPFYESPAEVRCLAGWGADALGMSTVPEALFARIRGFRIFALSGITNLGTGLDEASHDHEIVKRQAARLAPNAVRLLEHFLKQLASKSST